MAFFNAFANNWNAHIAPALENLGHHLAPAAEGLAKNAHYAAVNHVGPALHHAAVNHVGPALQGAAAQAAEGAHYAAVNHVGPALHHAAVNHVGPALQGAMAHVAENAGPAAMAAMRHAQDASAHVMPVVSSIGEGAQLVLYDQVAPFVSAKVAGEFGRLSKQVMDEAMLPLIKLNMDMFPVLGEAQDMVGDVVHKSAELYKAVQADVGVDVSGGGGFFFFSRVLVRGIPR
jgi:hypothetical protein